MNSDLRQLRLRKLIVDTCNQLRETNANFNASIDDEDAEALANAILSNPGSPVADPDRAPTGQAWMCPDGTWEQVDEFLAR